MITKMYYSFIEEWDHVAIEAHIYILQSLSDQKTSGENEIIEMYDY